MSCIHKEVCRYSDGICTKEEVCKFCHEGNGVLKTGRKRGRKPKPKGERVGRKRVKLKLTLSDEDVNRARRILRLRKMRDVLSSEQVQALDNIGSKRTPSLSDGEKEQLISMVNE